MIPLLFAEKDESAVMSFFDRWGNAASVVGLGIALIGFAATLWSVWRVKKDTRTVVGRVSGQLLSVEITVLLRLITDVRDAGRDGNWLRAIDRAQQARLIMVTLWHNPHLLRQEQDAFRAADDDLRLVVQYIENSRLPAGAPAENLPDPKKLALDRMVTTLGDIQGRLRGTTMEV
jgi:hypothetical protein